MSENTSKIIWRYLSSSNLLENIDEIDLEDIEKLSLIEQATHEGNYSEKELLDLYKKLTPYPEVKECLEGLKAKKIKIAILSNGTPNLLKGLVESNNIQNYFDDIMSIETVGIYKPDSKVYDLPIKKYQIKKDEVTFLSANTWDVSGGGVFGYNAVWVNRFNKVFDKLSYKPQFVINNLKELLKII